MNHMDQDDTRKIEPLYDEVRIFFAVLAICLVLAGIAWCIERLTARPHASAHASAPSGISVGGGTLR